MRHLVPLLSLMACLPLVPIRLERGEPPAAAGATTPGVVARFRPAHPVFHLAFSPDGKALATASYDRRKQALDKPAGISVWDVAADTERCFFPAHQGRAISVAFAPDGKTVFSAGEDKVLRCWDVARKAEVRRPGGPPAGWSCVACSPDGTTLASVGNNRIHLWDAATGRQLRTIGADDIYVCTVAFSPDGKTLASIGGMTVHLWDTASGKEVRQFQGKFLGSGGNFLSLAFSPDGKTLAAAAGNDPAIRFWNVATAEEVRSIPHGSTRIAFSPDGRMLAAQGPGNQVRLWEVATRRERCLLGEHRHWVQSLGFSPDGRALASGSEDGTVVVWDLRARRDGQRPVGANTLAREGEVLWGRLAGEDAAAAYEAIRSLCAAAEESVPWLKERLRPVPRQGPPLNEKAVARLIRDLDDDDFAVREKATAALEKVGKAVEPALQQALAGQPSPEVRQRVRGLLQKLRTPEHQEPSPEQLRALRALEVLEAVGTREARQVLEGLAGGAAEAWQTQEAKAALGRLSQRP